MADTSTNIIINLSFSGNVVGNCARDGIRLKAGDVAYDPPTIETLAICGNVIYLCTGDGIHLGRDAATNRGIAGRRTAVSANSVRSCGTYGILLQGGDAVNHSTDYIEHVSVFGNVVEEDRRGSTAQDYGIYLDDRSRYCAVVANVVRHAETANIEDSSLDPDLNDLSHNIDS